MSQAAAQPYVSYAEYVAAERDAETKHEWLAGVVYDMAGGTLEHSRLAAAMTRALGNLVQGRPCNVFSSDALVRVRATGLATYPDVTVVCGRAEVDPENDHAVTNPKLIVEVLSDSTEAYDRGKKFANYRQIPSLLEYVLVSQHEPSIEVYRRTDKGLWEFEEARAGQSIELKSLGGKVDVDEVYRDLSATAAL